MRNSKEMAKEVGERFPNGTKVVLTKNIGKADFLPRKGEVGTVHKIDGDGVLWIDLENDHYTGISCALVNKRIKEFQPI